MNKFKYLISLGVLFFLMSCQRIDRQEKSLLKKWVKKNLSKHWTLHLPANTLVSSFYSKSLLSPSTVVFPDDSLIIKYYFGYSALDKKDNCSFKARIKEAKLMASGGLCEGDGTGEHDYTAYINHISKLTGLLVNTKLEGCELVSLQVSDCESNEWLQLTFESVAPKHRVMINQILESLEFVK